MPIPTPSKGEKQSDFVSRCMGSEVMKKEYSDSKQRAAICYSQFKKKRTNNQMNNNLQVKVTLLVNETKNITFNNAPTTVIPAVLLVEGVHSGVGAGPLYYSSDVLEKYANVWNKAPITVGHPKDDDGQYVPCDTPEVYERCTVGNVFNSRYADNKIKADLYINTAKIEEQAPNFINDVLSYKNKGEISTGVVAVVDMEGGTWNGEDYEGTVTEIRGDHLALLPNDKGACSTSDGCGLLRNQAAKEDDNIIKGMIKHFLSGLLDYAKTEDGMFEKLEKLANAVRSQAPLGTSFWLVDAYKDYIVYERYKEGEESKLYKVKYSTTQNGEVEFNEAPIEVKVKKEYVEVKNKMKKEAINNMCCEDRVNALIANEDTPYGETDKEWLLGLNEEAFAKIEETAYKQPDVPETPPAEGGEEGGKQVNNEEKKVTMEDLPEDVQKTVRIGLKEYDAKKTKLITLITGSEKNKFTEDQLKAKDIEELEAIAALVEAPVPEGGEADYSGRSGGVFNTEGVEPMAVPTLADMNKE